MEQSECMVNRKVFDKLNAGIRTKHIYLPIQAYRTSPCVAGLCSALGGTRGVAIPCICLVDLLYS
jgi:hypothetical protein